jgi:hypothetical protein
MPFPSDLPTRRGTGARAHASRIQPRTGDTPFAPRRAPLHLGLRKGERCHLGRPDGLSRGSMGLSPRRSWHQGSKARGRAETRTPKPPTPIGVFPFLFSSESAERERGGRGRRRCIEPRRDAATPEHRRRAKDGDHNRRLEGRRGGRLHWGKEPSRSGNIHAAKDAYIAVNIFATPPSTPSWPRLHCRPNVSTAAANFLSPPP